MSYEELQESYGERQLIDLVYEILLMRPPSDKDVERVSAKIAQGDLSYRQLVISLMLSTEFMDTLAVDAIDNHLLFIHNTRVKLIRSVLPQADTILDIGGANGSLIEYGYPHPFAKLILTDLPAEERIAGLRKVDLKRKWELNEKVDVIFTHMTDLSMIEDNSIDLVWAGQVVEHITEDELVKSFKEIKRVLKVGGVFGFDTPNGIMTRIQSPDRLIHPEHKKEYTPDELREMIKPCFTSVQELGLIPMAESYRTRAFSYQEMVLNNTFSETLEHSYIIYFMCQKD